MLFNRDGGVCVHWRLLKQREKFNERAGIERSFKQRFVQFAHPLRGLRVVQAPRAPGLRALNLAPRAGQHGLPRGFANCATQPALAHRPRRSAASRAIAGALRQVKVPRERKRHALVQGLQRKPQRGGQQVRVNAVLIGGLEELVLPELAPK